MGSVLMIRASILIMGSMMNVAEAEEVIHLGGKVLCQDCTQGWKSGCSGCGGGCGGVGSGYGRVSGGCGSGGGSGGYGSSGGGDYYLYGFSEINGSYLPRLSNAATDFDEIVSSIAGVLFSTYLNQPPPYREIDSSLDGYDNENNPSEFEEASIRQLKKDKVELPHLRLD
ncbi:hypothetical protein LguiA_017156 [Lonicera macranthoides]